jgi:hypothetical protein
MPFKKGRSGNPAGRKPGSRNRVTDIIEHLLEGEAEALGRKAVELALAGNPHMLRTCLERIAPARRGRAVEFAMPSVTSPGDIAAAIGSILTAMSAGHLSPEEAAAAAKVVDAAAAAMARVEFEARIAALEAAHDQK